MTPIDFLWVLFFLVLVLFVPRLLGRLLHQHRHHPHHDLPADLIEITNLGDQSMFIGETITLLATPRRNDGTVGGLSTVPVWTADNTNVVLTPSTDGLTCTVEGTTLGAAVITCSALNTADPAVEVAGEFLVVVQLGPADFIEITQL